MKATGRLLLVISFACGFTGLVAQLNPANICRMEDGKLFFTLDARWNAQLRDSVARRFDLDSLLLEKVFRHEPLLQYPGWNATYPTKISIELSTSMNLNPLNQVTASDIFILDDNWLASNAREPVLQATFGVNNLVNPVVFQFRKGVAEFFLPGYPNAGKVYLSGSFNDWSTNQIPMQRTDSGWVARARLKPGKYAYKYIVDGKWKEDPNNRSRELDGANGHNSIIFCTNYEFHISGRTDARRLILAGSFTGWNPDGPRMIRTANGWRLPVYLDEGTYAYKFIVDNEWITDPANKDIRRDADGNLNSFLGFGEAFHFLLHGFPDAKSVVLSGSFNGWSRNELLMQKVEGDWQISYILAPGTYEYKFIVDGNWITDPGNPVTTVSGKYANSVLVFKPNFTFILNGFETANQVAVSGTFNGWDRSGYKMYRQNGKWIFPVFLKPGKYLYKFIVDGKWILDPDNKLWEENEYGTGNSVLWVGQ